MKSITMCCEWGCLLNSTLGEIFETISNTETGGFVRQRHDTKMRHILGVGPERMSMLIHVLKRGIVSDNAVMMRCVIPLVFRIKPPVSTPITTVKSPRGCFIPTRADRAG